MNWKNFFPKNAESVKEDGIYSENVKLAYDEGLIIKSSGGASRVNESTLRDPENFFRRHIYDAEMEMKFSFESGASTDVAVGAAFTTYLKGSGTVISYRFLVGADGNFYSFIDSAEYSGYKKDLKQFTATPISTPLLIDGSENTLHFSRKPRNWNISLNGQTVAEVPDNRYFPVNAARGIRFLFAGKFALKLHSLTEDYTLFESLVFEDLALARKAEGNGYKIKDLNAEGDGIVDPNGGLRFELTTGDVQAILSSPALGGEVKIKLSKTIDDTFEKNSIPVKLGYEYEITTFTLDPDLKTWYMEASKKEYSGDTEKTAFQTVTETIVTTKTLMFRGSK